MDASRESSKKAAYQVGTVLDEGAFMPKRADTFACGFDLYARDTGTIHPGDRKLIKTGVHCTLRPGTYGRICDRSGLAYNFGITTIAGQIDENYRGDIGVILFNSGTKIFHYVPGDRIAQMVISKYEAPEFVQVDSLEETERGESGFGSTGK